MSRLQIIILLLISFATHVGATVCLAEPLGEQSGFGLAVKLASSEKGFELSIRAEAPEFSFAANDVTIHTVDDPSRLIVVLPYRGSLSPKAVQIDHPPLTNLRFGLHPEKLRVVVDAAGPVIFEVALPEISPDGTLIIRFAQLNADSPPTKSAQSSPAEPTGIPPSPVVAATRMHEPPPRGQMAPSRVITIPTPQVSRPTALPPPATTVSAYTVKNQVVERVDIDRKPTISRIFWGLTTPRSSFIESAEQAPQQATAPTSQSKDAPAVPNPEVQFADEDVIVSESAGNPEDELLYEELPPPPDNRTEIGRYLPFGAIAIAVLVMVLRYLPLGLMRRQARRVKHGYRRRRKRRPTADLSVYYKILALDEDASDAELDERYREFVRQREAALASEVRKSKVPSPLELQFPLIGEAYQALKKARREGAKMH